MPAFKSKAPELISFLSLDNLNPPRCKENCVGEQKTSKATLTVLSTLKEKCM